MQRHILIDVHIYNNVYKNTKSHIKKTFEIEKALFNNVLLLQILFTLCNDNNSFETLTTRLKSNSTEQLHQHMARN